MAHTITDVDVAKLIADQKAAVEYARRELENAEKKLEIMVQGARLFGLSVDLAIANPAGTVTVLEVKAGRRGDPNSSVGRAIAALRRAGHDLHADTLLTQINGDGGPKVKKPTLVSNLSSMAKKGKMFRRTPNKANSFGLLEWGNGAATEQVQLLA